MSKVYAEVKYPQKVDNTQKICNQCKQFPTSSPIIPKLGICKSCFEKNEMHTIYKQLHLHPKFKDTDFYNNIHCKYDSELHNHTLAQLYREDTNVL